MFFCSALINFLLVFFTVNEEKQQLISAFRDPHDVMEMMKFGEGVSF